MQKLRRSLGALALCATTLAASTVYAAPQAGRWGRGRKSDGLITCGHRSRSAPAPCTAVRTAGSGLDTIAANIYTHS